MVVHLSGKGILFIFVIGVALFVVQLQWYLGTNSTLRQPHIPQLQSNDIECSYLVELLQDMDVHIEPKPFDLWRYVDDRGFMNVRQAWEGYVRYHAKALKFKHSSNVKFLVYPSFQ
jgi:hypothetical protein